MIYLLGSRRMIYKHNHLSHVITLGFGFIWIRYANNTCLKAISTLIHQDYLPRGLNHIFFTVILSQYVWPLLLTTCFLLSTCSMYSTAAYPSIPQPRNTMVPMIIGKTQTPRELVMKATTKPSDSHIL